MTLDPSRCSQGEVDTSVSTSPSDPSDAVLRVGDRVRVHLNFARWVGKRPTSRLVVATIARTPDGTVILGLHWSPSEDVSGTSDGAQTEETERGR